MALVSQGQSQRRTKGDGGGCRERPAERPITTLRYLHTNTHTQKHTYIYTNITCVVREESKQNECNLNCVIVVVSRFGVYDFQVQINENVIL